MFSQRDERSRSLILTQGDVAYPYTEETEGRSDERGILVESTPQNLRISSSLNGVSNYNQDENYEEKERFNPQISIQNLNDDAEDDAVIEKDKTIMEEER